MFNQSGLAESPNLSIERIATAGPPVISSPWIVVQFLKKIFDLALRNQLLVPKICDL
jgi:hypothetical protein